MVIAQLGHLKQIELGIEQTAGRGGGRRLRQGTALLSNQWHIVYFLCQPPGLLHLEFHIVKETKRITTDQVWAQYHLLVQRKQVALGSSPTRLILLGRKKFCFLVQRIKGELHHIIASFMGRHTIENEIRIDVVSLCSVVRLNLKPVFLN